MTDAVQGIVALFDDPDAILRAAQETRDRGYQHWDVFTPFPVHGMDKAMGMGPSRIPWVTFCAGLLGVCSGFGIQLYTMAVSWPQNYGGKPLIPWPAFVPISFETTVALAGLCTAFAALWFGRVLRLKKPNLDPAISCDRFALYIEATDPRFDPAESVRQLQDLGAIEVRLVEHKENT